MRATQATSNPVFMPYFVTWGTRSYVFVPKSRNFIWIKQIEDCIQNDLLSENTVEGVQLGKTGIKVTKEKRNKLWRI